MSDLSRLGEIRIEEAIASGELRPPAAGTALDMESYFRTPAEWRSAYAMLKGNGFVTPEVELLKEAAALEERLADCTDASERIELRRRIQDVRTRFRIAVERQGLPGYGS